MKKLLYSLCTIILCAITAGLLVSNTGWAATKKKVKREISIVFDNSGSMYINDNAWCRATYAVEVFASMLNEDDSLRVYPMNKMTAGHTGYNMTNPLVVHGGDDTSVIRECYTVDDKGDTHIETVSEAYKGVEKLDADEKWLIVLTDGAEFYKNKKKMSKADSEKELSKMLSKYNKNVNVMYLGIGSDPVIPSVKKSKFKYYPYKANTSDMILKSLTEMSNTIFGRDELEGSKKKMSFDIGMNKLIIFVQGTDISNIKVTDSSGNTVGDPDKIYTPKYSKKGSGASNFKIDKNLSGVIAIYSNIDKGDYNLEYKGTATDVGVYYEPDVDLMVRLTDAAGTPVTSGAEMYPGEYYIEYGLIDSTGAYTDSSLLGKRSFNILYSVNGVSYTENSDKNDKIRVELNAADTIDVSAGVTYLGAYEIKKNGEELGWPAGGLSISDWPVGQFIMSVSGGKEVYDLAALEEDGKYKLDFIYDGQPVVGEQLDRIQVEAAVEGGNLMLESVKGDDGIYLNLKNQGEAYETEKGDYTLSVNATYTDEHDKTMTDAASVPFTVEGEVHYLEADFVKGKSFYQISKIDEEEQLNVKLQKDGNELTDDELNRVELVIDAGELPIIAKPVPGDSSFDLLIEDKSMVQPGKYKIIVNASLLDETGYNIEADDSKHVEYRPYPGWVPILIRLLILLVILLAILIYMTRKVMPRTIVFEPGKASRPMGTVVNLKAESHYQRKNKMLEINGRSSLHPDVGSVNIIFKLEPASRRYVKSKRRKVKITGIEVSAAKAADAPKTTVTCGSCTYEKKNRNGKEEPSVRLSGDVKKGTRVSFKTTAADGGITKNVKIDGELIFR